jgi:terminase small subunit-like protein
MAAKPIERFIKRQIAEQGGWERILERIASGETVADVARTLLRPDGMSISRSFFSHMLHHDAERSQRVMALRPESAHAMVDEGLHLVDRAPIDRDSINKAKVQAELRLKVAGFIDRQQWGEQKQAMHVEVNVASMHLDALRHRIVEASRPLAALLNGVPVTDTGSAADSNSATYCTPDTAPIDDSAARTEPEGTRAA